MKPLGRPVYDVLYEICLNNLQSKIILLHGGYCELLETSEMIRPLGNVILDLSYTLLRFRETHLVDDIKFLFQTFDRRICIGSDFPENTISDVIKVIEEKKLAEGLNETSIGNILHDNLARLFKCV